MASRVNIRFVVILSLSLVLVFALSAGVFIYVKGKSADRYIRLGDEALAKGAIADADEFYSVAVHKDRTNVFYLTKWRAARELKVPQSDTEYSGEYQMYLYGILNSLARLQRHNTEAQRDYLQALLEHVSAYGRSRESWEFLVQEVEASLAGVEPEQPPQVRRFRGLATAGLMAVGAEVPRDRLETAQADLAAALAANPRDFEAAEQLDYIYRVLAERARAGGNRDELRALLEKSAAVVRSVVAAEPGDPSVMMIRLMADAGATDFAEDPTGTIAGQRQARAVALDALRPRVAEVRAALVATDANALRMPVVLRFIRLAPMLDRQAGAEHAQAVLDHVLTAHPDQAELLVLRARNLAALGRLDEAIAVHGAVLELARRPVSLRGLTLMETQRRARFEQANLAVGAAALATAEQRPAAMESARAYRAKLAGDVAERSPELIYIDAKIMFVSGDLRGAQAALTEFVRTPGDIRDQVADAHQLIASIAMMLNPPQLGLARDTYRLVLQERPGAVQIMVALAGVEMALENRSAAAELYRAVLEIDPQNAVAGARLPLLQGRTEDPVIRVLLDAEALARGSGATLGDARAAAALVEAALERHAHDPRLVRAAVQLRLNAGEREAAERLLAKGIALHPADEGLKAVQRSMKVTGSLEGALAALEESGATPLDMALNRKRIYESYDKPAEARAALDEAARIAPDDPRVLESRFVEALLKPDLPEAARLADHAAKLNADSADGDTYRARLQIGQGNLRDAAALLERAAKRGNATPALLRLLGDACMRLGRGQDAVAAYRQAVDLNPADIVSIRFHVAALAQTGRRQEALSAARAAESLARRDPLFLNMWLDLEAEAGNTNFARERREEVLASDPANAGNTGALADLFIRERNWDRARALIDSLRSTRDSINAALLDARWHTARNDLPRASTLLGDFVAALPESERAAGHMHISRFLLQAGQPDAALASMRQAAPFQDPKTMPVDLEIGDTLIMQSRFAEAEAVFRKVLDAGIADPRFAIRKSLIECLLLQGRSADAEAMLSQIGEGAEQDMQLVAQRATALRALGRARDARDLLDRTISRYPEEPAPYLHRARLSLADPALSSDAVADLNAAIRLSPSFWQALRARAQVAWGQKRYADALKDWDAAVKAFPTFDDLRWELVERLLAQGRERDAAVAAEDGAKLRPGDARYLAAAAARFERAGQWARAAEFYKQVLALAPGEEAAALCLNAMLSAVPPLLADAERILATPGLEVDKSIRLLLARAAVRKLQSREPQMRADLLAAFDLVRDPQTFTQWFEGMRRVVGSPVAAVALVDALRPHESLAEWVALSRAVALLDDTPQRAESVRQLSALAASARDPGVRHNAAMAAATTLTRDKKFEEAVAVGRHGLAVAPDDVMLNNNTAYILSEELNRPAEALAMAEKALAAAPASLEIIDTAASVYWRLGQREKAIQTASTALRLSRNDADKFRLMLKLGRWKLEMGDTSGAAGILGMLRELAAELTSLTPDETASFADLQKDIEAR
ncbi:MAG: tetratricopeptide repeat protein [Phycisphaerales bacterium]